MALPNIIQQINSKLPLSGGTITGNLVIKGNIFACKEKENNGYLLIGAGSDWNDASSLILYSHTYTDNSSWSGGFALRSISSDKVIKDLIGLPDGTLTWCGNNVITSAGGTFNGILKFSNCDGVIRSEINVDAENRPLYQLSLGYESHSQLGGYILLRRGDSTAYGQAGMAALCAASPDGTRKYLMCYPNGNLFWNDKPVMSIIYEAGGIITYSNGLTFQWGSSYGSTTVNFPQPFAGYPVVYTTNNAVLDTSCNSTTYVTGITPTYFTTYKIRGNSGNQVQDGGQFSWFALGYR